MMPWIRFQEGFYLVKGVNNEALKEADIVGSLLFFLIKAKA